MASPHKNTLTEKEKSVYFGTGDETGITKVIKKLPPNSEAIKPGVYLVTYGKGFTRNTEIYMAFMSTKEEVKNLLLNKSQGDPFLKSDKKFEFLCEEGERDSIKILNDAGLPEYRPESFDAPGGLLGALELRGYRAHEDPEWYAAGIIQALSKIRSTIKEKDADSAAAFGVMLGVLMTEGWVFNYYKKIGKTGGPKERRNLAYTTLTRYLVRKYRVEPASELWGMIPNNSEDELEVGSYKYYRDAKRIYALRRVSGRKWESVGKPLQYDAFRKRIIQARKPSLGKPSTR